MRAFLTSLVLCAAAAAGAIWALPYHAPDMATAIKRTAPRHFVVAIRHPVDIKAYDRNWWLNRTMVTEDAPAAQPAVTIDVLPRPRPQSMPAKAEPQQQLLAQARAALGQGPRQLGVRSSLWCMAAINKWLAHIGVKGTGSDLAASVRHWGKPARPAAGVVGLMPRRGGSGHVVVIEKIKGGTVYAVSPNGGHNRVRYATYPVRRFIAFRAPA